MTRTEIELQDVTARLTCLTDALKNLMAAHTSATARRNRCVEALESLAEDLDEGGCDPRAVAKKIRAQATALARE